MRVVAIWERKKGEKLFDEASKRIKSLTGSGECTFRYNDLSSLQSELATIAKSEAVAWLEIVSHGNAFFCNPICKSNLAGFCKQLKDDKVFTKDAQIFLSACWTGGCREIPCLADLMCSALGQKVHGGMGFLDKGTLFESINGGAGAIGLKSTKTIQIRGTGGKLIHIVSPATFLQKLGINTRPNRNFSTRTTPPDCDTDCERCAQGICCFDQFTSSGTLAALLSASEGAPLSVYLFEELPLDDHLREELGRLIEDLLCTDDNSEEMPYRLAPEMVIVKADRAVSLYGEGQVLASGGMFVQFDATVELQRRLYEIRSARVRTEQLGFWKTLRKRAFKR